MAATNDTRPRTSRGAACPADGGSPETHPPDPAAVAPLQSAEGAAHGAFLKIDLPSAGGVDP
jgi:hypothetical protein